MLNALLIAGLAVAIYGVTQLVKTSIDIGMGYVDVNGKRVPKRKSDLKKYAWLNRLLLPALPPTLGLLMGAFVPFRPEPLIEYVTTHHEGFWGVVAYSCYGGIIGVFADTIYTKVKKAVQDYRQPPTQF